MPHGKQNTAFEGVLSLPKQPSRMNISTKVALSVNYLNYRPNEIVFVRGGWGEINPLVDGLLILNNHY